MKHDVIILTAGLTGSSVVAGLLKQAGYWVGEATAKKPEYDTFENTALVALNDRLLQAVGHDERFDRVFRRGQIDDVGRAAARVDLAPYRQFIAECVRHEPWVWKDPRLWLTIRVWAPLLDRERLRIVVVSRQHSQAWISHILRRQIQTPGYCRDYMEGVRAALLEFIAEYKLPHIEIVYEDILFKPEQVIEKLGDFLETDIAMSDLQKFYRGPLYRRKHGVGDFLRAIMIYLKNYPHRLRR
jgi:hypothetical protein